MSKYTFTYEHDDGSKVIVEGYQDNIFEMAFDIANFLRGVSFSDSLVKQVINLVE